MNSLVIGDTSQLSYYFPKEYERISSSFIRNDLPLPLKDDYYDRVYITFAEQRLHQSVDVDTYFNVNVHKTIQVINFFKHKANAIVIYGTCELWNNYTGEIDLSLSFSYDTQCDYSAYCASKETLVHMTKKLKLNNVIILHPFNFNSPYRKQGFLFSKIFDSIINKTKIKIGDTYYYRDMIHPKYVVERSMKANSDELVGSGRLIFVNDLIRDLYRLNNMEYENYVTEDLKLNFPKRNPYYLKSKEIKYSYSQLLQDTLEDITKTKTT